MSAPLVLTPRNTRRLADALDALTTMTRETGVRIDAYSAVTLRIGEATIEARWDDEDRTYIIDDRVGA